MSSTILNDSMFWTVGVGGFIIGIVGITIKYIYKIKCLDCSFCFGCIHCTRNTEGELHKDEIPTPTQHDDGESSQASCKLTRTFSKQNNNSNNNVYSKV